MDGEPGTDAGRRQVEQAAAFDEIGDRYDEAFPHKEGQIAAVDQLLAELPAQARVLDAGCGTGLPTARRLAHAGCDVTGIDISPGMLDLARRNVPEARFLHRDILDIDTSLGTFDAIVAFFSVLMLPRADIPTSLRTLHAALAPGGLLCLGMVEADLDYAPIHFVGSRIWVTGYVREQLQHIVETHGFTVETSHAYPYAPATTEAMPEVQLFLQCRAHP